MSSGVFFQSVLAAISAGSVCSVCGASVNSAFLSAYIISHKRLTLPVLSFLAGKTAVIVALCSLSAGFGRVIMDSSGFAGKFDIYLFAQVLVLCTACFMAARWIYFERKGGCPSGGHCSGGGTADSQAGGAAALFASGVSCGATPCAPLIVVLSQSAASTLPVAMASGAAFSVTGFLSPVVIWLAVSRVLAKKMHREISQWIKWFQFGCYVLLIAVTIYTIIIYKL